LNKNNIIYKKIVDNEAIMRYYQNNLINKVYKVTERTYMTQIVGTPSAIKLLNKDVIEEMIRSKGPITKPEIANLTKLSLVTVNKTVAILLEEKKVKVSGVNKSTGGRRAQFFEINDEVNYYIGLYYDKNHYIGAISNSIGKIIFEQKFSIRIDIYEEVMEDTYSALDLLIARCEEHIIKAIGIGVPGVVKEGIITNIPNIPTWEGKDIAGLISEKYQIPVYLENDINLTTLGVYALKYQKDKINNLALIYLEQGLGSGFIINSSLFKGTTNFAGELGYLPVQNNFPSAGKTTKYKGNFEAQISLINEAIEHSNKNELVIYKEMLINTITNGLLSVICVLNPEIIVINHSYITNQDCRSIGRLLGTWIDDSNIPVIINAQNLNKCSIHGVFTMCISESTLSYSLSNKKRG